MSFKEREGYYYEFSVDALFINPDLIDSYHRRLLGANHIHQRLGEFISQNIVKEGLQFTSDRVFLITKDQDKALEVKEFCNFLVKTGSLLNITLTNILDKFDLDKYKLELNDAYQKFRLQETLNVELVEKENNGKKKLKV